MGQPDELDGRYQLPLYVTEGEIIKRMGVGINAGRKAIQKMRLHPRFPPQTIGAKRYWPSVVDFLDRWNGRGTDVRMAPTERSIRASEPSAPPPRLGPQADEASRARYGYTDENGNFRKIVAGLRAGQIRVTSPDGRKWIEDANETDPRLWHRKRPFKPRTRKPTPPSSE